MIDDRDIDGSAGECFGGLFVHVYELFEGGLFRVVVLVVKAHGQDNNVCLCVNGGFLQDFPEVVEGGTGVAVYLNVWVIEWGDSLEVRVAEEQDRPPANNVPVLCFFLWAGLMGGGFVEYRCVWSCCVWGGCRGGAGVSSMRRGDCGGVGSGVVSEGA